MGHIRGAITSTQTEPVDIGIQKDSSTVTSIMKTLDVN